jgi:CBS domain containing-hemolysin-like protein
MPIGLEPVHSVLIGLLLVVGNAFFVAAEFSLIGARRSRIQALAKRGNSSARAVLAALDDVANYIAGIQIAITMCGIGLGVVAEPAIAHWLSGSVGGWLGRPASFAISFVLATLVLVVVGELVPKYVTLKNADRTALFLIRPLRFTVLLLRPLSWVVQRSGALVLLPFGIKMDRYEADVISREELMLLVASSKSSGVLEHVHAQLLTNALKLDVLVARDIMVHRLDIQWLPLNLPREEILAGLSRIPHSRIPICRDDLDDVVGFVFVHDVIRHMNEPDFSLEKVVRPLIGVPENLSLNRLIETMRAERTQILIVMDEYGGTSGMLTLEDVVEEVFGELQDQLESERPPIEWMPAGRVSARAEVRYDELASFLGIEPGEELHTETLATILVNALGRVPKLGDSVETPLGLLRVENMARRRITRVSLFPIQGQESEVSASSA